MDVIGVGALNVDLLYKVTSLDLAGQKFESGGEVFGDDNSFKNVLDILDNGGGLVCQSGGGSAANTIYALARMGYQTGYLGVIGKDEYGDFLLKSLPGVDIKHIKRYKRSGMCISLLKEKDRSLIVLPNSNDMFSYTEDDISYLNSARFIHMTSFVGDLAFEAQKRLFGMIDEGVDVSFSPGELYARRGLKSVRNMIARSRLLFVNERELMLLTGKTGIDGCRVLLDIGPKVIICTSGEEGSLILSKNEELLIPPKRTVVVDKTGAGDVYAAGFLAGYLDGSTLEQCGRMASTVAALSIASFGRDGYPDKRFMKTFEKGLS